MGTCVCRFHARRRREAKACEKVESSDLNHTPNRKKMEIRVPPAKPAASKSSVLQSIYGKIIRILHKNIVFLSTSFSYLLNNNNKSENRGMITLDFGQKTALYSALRKDMIEK